MGYLCQVYICILVVPWDHKVLLRVCSAFEVKIEGKEVEYSRNQYFARRIRKTPYGTGSVQLICINLIFATQIKKKGTYYKHPKRGFFWSLGGHWDR